jgi:hypothetical protein
MSSFEGKTSLDFNNPFTYITVNDDGSENVFRSPIPLDAAAIPNGGNTIGLITPPESTGIADSQAGGNTTVLLSGGGSSSSESGMDTTTMMLIAAGIVVLIFIIK